ncbi:MAG: class I SAM-dependent methyltransferase [Solirubrobacteraceae bacterium]
MSHERDVAAFGARAPRYEEGRLGRMHHEIADAVLAIALALDPTPDRLLDVGCGTGYLLRQAAARLPAASELVGVDPAAGMIAVARTAAADHRLMFRAGVAEELPFADASFDLVVATTSFDHWSDQRAGLSEVARALRPGGHFVLADLLSLWLMPTVLTLRRGRARTIRRAHSLLEDVGLQPIGRQSVHTVVQAVSARRPLG